ncbi:MAG: ribonuclease III domain-containing protein [Erysipelotrichaceae bacterium]|nr:ribonuclease III domain-containing protein [Erysipelotrichaceae bacterium]
MIQPSQLNGGVLAFIGDGVMTLMVREYLIKQGYTKAKQLQELSVKYVSAKAQSQFMSKIISDLNEQETEIFKRGRNYKSNSMPKNADVYEYHIATGLEALWGYWYLSNEKERLDNFFVQMIKENSLD